MDTYSTPLSASMTLDKLKNMMSALGGTRLFVKHFSANDNSKNQPYLGGDYSSLRIIPTGKMTASACASDKKTAGNKQNIKAPVNFTWVGADCELYPAPNTKLILYPQYPEVRMSGFLQGSKVNLSRWMDPHKEGRAEGRILILAVGQNDEVYGYLATPNSQLASILNSYEDRV